MTQTTKNAAVATLAAVARGWISQWGGDADHKLAREFQALGRRDVRWYSYSRGGDVPGAPALSEDPALRRFYADVSAADLDRLADADTADIVARLPGWREEGRALLARDFALVTDYTAARAGDDAARDRLRASVAEGGHGEPDLAIASTWGHARDLSGMTLAEAADTLEGYALALAQDRLEYDLGDGVDEARDLAELHACSDYVEVRDYEEGDEPGRYYR